MIGSLNALGTVCMEDINERPYLYGPRDQKKSQIRCQQGDCILMLAFRILIGFSSSTSVSFPTCICLIQTQRGCRILSPAKNNWNKTPTKINVTLQKTCSVQMEGPVLLAKFQLHFPRTLDILNKLNIWGCGFLQFLIPGNSLIIFNLGVRLNRFYSSINARRFSRQLRASWGE